MVADDRDRADGRLRGITAWTAGISAALVGVFAGIAAATIPGTSAAAATSTPSGNDPLAVAPSPPTDDDEDQSPANAPLANAPVAAPAGNPHAVSGASSHR